MKGGNVFNFPLWGSNSSPLCVLIAWRYMAYSINVITIRTLLKEKKKETKKSDSREDWKLNLVCAGNVCWPPNKRRMALVVFVNAWGLILFLFFYCCWQPKIKIEVKTEEIRSFWHELDMQGRFQKMIERRTFMWRWRNVKFKDIYYF